MPGPSSSHRPSPVTTSRRTATGAAWSKKATPREGPGRGRRDGASTERFLATGRAVTGALRQEQGVEAFVGRHEDGGLELLHGPAPRDRHRERRGIDVAGHVDEHEHVVVAERVVPREDLSAQLLDDRLERL